MSVTDKSLPKITNIYVTPGKKVALRLNQPKHLLATMIPRGSHRLCFKLSSEYCKANLPEAYNNSLLDIHLNTGEAKLYPKAEIIPEVYQAMTEIIREFTDAGLVIDDNLK